MDMRRAANYALWLLRTRPPLSYFADYRYRRRLRRHARSIPFGHPLAREVVETVYRLGCIRLPLDELALDSTPQLMEAAEEVLARWRPEQGFVNASEACALRPDSTMIDGFPGLFLWGLDEKLLDIVERYLGLPPLYLGVEFKREPADGSTANVRQWHTDVEDRRIVKILIYLNDVDSRTGPFEFVPLEETRLATAALGYRSGFVSDADLARHLSTEGQVAVTGPRWTVAIFDGAQVLHRARPPAETDRLSITFSYTSRHPMRLWSNGASSALMQRVGGLLSERQLACVHTA